ncbi:pyrroline-5-carboxylate reductase [Aspergillus lucknowensis]|uniref:Pyrroline-5-carboxylate reductase dimerization-domain-containing protein n=1 Tax=Aspergillus lucknowensis TaxID=176173 RepID=A0ABR4LFM0_9EURO
METNLTLAIIGCGNMGSAILSGILDADATTTTTTNTTSKESPFSRIIACTGTQASAEKLRKRYAGHASSIVLDFRSGDNCAAAAQSDVVMLGCKPYLIDAVLAAEGVADAMVGKLVVSLIAGKTVRVLSECIAKHASEEAGAVEGKAGEKGTIVARAMPNVAASVRESMTVVELEDTCPPRYVRLINWMFSQIGRVKVLGADTFDCGTMLMASAASVSVAVDGLLDGCVAEGMRRADASEIVSQCLLGLAKLLQDGEHPAALRESMASPRGCTIQGLLTLEKAGVRSAFAESVINGTRHLQELQRKQE